MLEHDLRDKADGMKDRLEDDDDQDDKEEDPELDDLEDEQAELRNIEAKGMHHGNRPIY